MLGGGPTVEGTVDFLRNTGMGEAVLKGASTELMDTALHAVTAALTPFATPVGVKLDGAVWIVTARRPPS